ncbi:MAG: NAD(+)/NADH kinase [Clostridia bacterium]|nr:NAD(+)/NADH kinase [Clostridia bacterium]
MKVGIFYKENKVRDESVIVHISQLIDRRGSKAVVFRSAEEIDGVDRLLVLGGDGTVLSAAKAASKTGVPIVGINYGTLGFLTEFERNEIENAVDLILDEECAVVSHAMLEVDLNGVKTHCLNEMTLHRNISAKKDVQIATITVKIDGSSAGDFRADGLIVCTPTGSTAYSLSAGGSIMTPDCPTFMITPLCAFSLKSRPIAYSDNSTLSFEFPSHLGSLILYGDGKFLGEVKGDDALIVRKSNRVVRFLTKDRNGFFRRLTEKISY